MKNYSRNVKAYFEEKGIPVNDELHFENVLELVKERCTLLTDFYGQAVFFFKDPEQYDEAAVKPKWDAAKADFFGELVSRCAAAEWNTANIETLFKEVASEKQQAGRIADAVPGDAGGLKNGARGFCDCGRHWPGSYRKKNPQSP